MELKDELIVKGVHVVARSNGSTSKSYGWVVQDIALHGKAVSIDFYLINYDALYNCVPGYDKTRR